MTTNLQLDRFGGRVNHELGALLLSTDVNRIGDMAIQSLVHLLGLLFYDSTPGHAAPQSGFPGDMCLVSMTGDLSYTVAPGWGLMFDASELGSEDWGIAAYRPIVLADAVSGALAANDATHPRIDVISIGPAWVDDLVVSRNFKNPTTGARHVTGMPQRRRFGAQVVVTTGTPDASPVAPPTPTGHIKLADVHVPAGAGPATVVDRRPLLTLAREFRPVPGENYVVEGLEPSIVGLTGAQVGAGVAEIGGVRYRFAPTGELQPTHNVGAPSRYDLLVARADGTIELLEGTTTRPTQDDAPEGSVLVGVVVVKGASADVQAVLDEREFGHIGPAQLRAGAVVATIADGELPGAKLTNATVTTAKLAEAARSIHVQLTHQGYNGANQRHTILAQVVDANGAPVSRVVDLSCVMRDATWNPGGANATQFVISAGAPWDISGAGSQRLIRTNGSGQVTILATHPSPPTGPGNTVYLEILPLGTPGGGGYLAFPVDAAP